MDTICIVTSTRADFGILHPLLQRILASPDLALRLVVTGSHLSDQHGGTWQEIAASGIPIHQKIPILPDGDREKDMSAAMGNALTAFGNYFEDCRPDLLIALGDRFEMAAVCCAAINARIPIGHIHGGETTEGAVDDSYRHAITKMSLLHFTSCEAYRKRVIQLGEHPARVFNVGALGVENILHTPLLSVDALSHSIDFGLREREYAVVTFHPVTLEANTGPAQVTALMEALDRFPDMRFIITKSNADAGGQEINRLWDEYGRSRENVLVTASLGMVRYLSALRHAAVMIGNSSSGLLEGPASKIPTVDIGDRQKGRIAAESVIHCEPDANSITAAIRRALTGEFQSVAAAAPNPYGDGDTSAKILAEIKRFLAGERDIKKEFYNIDFEV